MDLNKIWNSKYNPFGNYDNSIPDWVYLKFAKYPMHKVLAFLYWYFWRNPLHNFCHYWIGTGNYPACWKTWHISRKWNLILPFFSYDGNKWQFYVGWRPKDNGSQIFGLCLRRKKDAKT
ncbi:MAG: hypothetical protein QXJ20_02705 [Candidatus Aenigmatarchaeota archaeon]